MAITLHTFLEIEVLAVQSLVVAVSAGLRAHEQQLRLLLLAHVLVGGQSNSMRSCDSLLQTTSKRAVELSNLLAQEKASISVG